MIIPHLATPSNVSYLRKSIRNKQFPSELEVDPESFTIPTYGGVYIYLIYNPTVDKGYLGMTLNKLSLRLSQHKSQSTCPEVQVWLQKDAKVQYASLWFSTQGEASKFEDTILNTYDDDWLVNPEKGNWLKGPVPFDLSKCGTRAGAHQHYQRGIPTCDACRLAETQRKRRQRRKGKSV